MAGLMEAPKNTDTTTLIFGGMSLAGSLATLYAYTGGRLAFLPGFPEQIYLNFTIVAFGLYALGFVLAPKFLLMENFNTTPDAYHLALARCMGYAFLLNCYTIYIGWLGTNTMAFALLWSFGVGIFGPTYNAFYLDCKMTPTGHMPGNVLFLIGGYLAITAQ